MEATFEVLASPLKSPQDKKEYKVIRLENSLTATLIVDKDSFLIDGGGGSSYEDKMAAASLSINVGSFSNPEHIPGLAHCLEHMVFMGSKKYPDENDFSSYINQKGGSYNAVTECERTTFFFTCLKQHFRPALDKFAQFFIAPLIKKDSIAKEREAIESGLCKKRAFWNFKVEFQMALPSDGLREMQVIANCAKKDSPANYFVWGNLTTLKENISEDNLYDELHKFRERHYSAHRMKLTIQAPVPMEILESYVLDCFSKIPSNHLPPEDFEKYTDSFDTPEFSQIYYIQPLNKTCKLNLRWALPSVLHKYKAKPHVVVSWLLGDEGKGSLLSYLKKKLWVLSLNAGVETGSRHSNSFYSLFMVTMILTDEGLAHLCEIIQAVFSCIRMLKEVGPQEWYHNELKKLIDTSFKYSSEDSAVDTALDISVSMHLYPPEEYITGPSLLTEYYPDFIEAILNCLVPEKTNITILTDNLPHELSFDKTEKWFGAKYAQQEIPSDWLTAWKSAGLLSELSIPPPNPFLPENFSLLDNDNDHPSYPEKVLSSEFAELWFRKDQEFKLPVAYYYFYLINPLCRRSPSTQVMTELFTNLLPFQLNEELYPAVMAGLSYSFDSDDYGIVFQVTGYNEKIPMTVELIINRLLQFNLHLTEETFRAMKQKMSDCYYNYLLEPSCLVEDVRYNLLIERHHSCLDKYNVISHITCEDIKRFLTEFLNRLYVKVLIQGNVTKETAVNVVNNFVTGLNYCPFNCNTYASKYRVRKIPKGQSLFRQKSFNANDSNSIVICYYQCEPFSLMTTMIIQIFIVNYCDQFYQPNLCFFDHMSFYFYYAKTELQRIMQGPLFDTLRTKEQLGYDVSCTDRDTFGILGFSISVTSQNDTDFVNSRIEVFVKSVLELIKDMSEETFNDMKKDMIKERECRDLHLSTEIARNWAEITEGDYVFDRVEREIKMLEQVEIEDVRELIVKYFSCDEQEHYKKLTIQIVSHNDDENENKNFTLDEKIAFNFLESKDDCNEKSLSLVKNIDDFKDSLYLYPVINRIYTC